MSLTQHQREFLDAVEAVHAELSEQVAVWFGYVDESGNDAWSVVNVSAIVKLMDAKQRLSRGMSADTDGFVKVLESECTKTDLNGQGKIRFKNGDEFGVRSVYMVIRGAEYYIASVSDPVYGRVYCELKASDRHYTNPMQLDP